MTGRCVGEDLRPDRLGRAHHDRVGVLQGLVGQHRRMNSAQHHRLASRAIPIRDLVGAAGLNGHGGDADQVDAWVVVSNVISQMLLHDRDVMGRRGERCQELKGSAFDLSSTQPDARIWIRIDELDFHFAYTIARDRRGGMWQLRSLAFCSFGRSNATVTSPLLRRLAS